MYSSIKTNLFKLSLTSKKRLVPFLIICVVVGVIAKEVWLYLSQTETQYSTLPYGAKMLPRTGGPDDYKDFKSSIRIGRYSNIESSPDPMEGVVPGKENSGDMGNKQLIVGSAKSTGRYMTFDEFDFREKETDLYKKFEKAMTEDDFMSSLKFEKWGTNCILPKLDPCHASIKLKVKKYRGDMEFPCRIDNAKLIVIQDGHLLYDREAIANTYFQNDTIKCMYREILRDVTNPDPDNFIKYGPSVQFEHGTSVSHIQFLNIYCIGGNGEIIHEDILSQPQIRDSPMEPMPTKDLIPVSDEELRERPNPDMKDFLGKSSLEGDPPLPPFNIVMLGLDSVSRVNYHRHMLKTESYVERQFSTVEFMAHHKIGDNTLPNLMVLLLGQYYQHVICGDRTTTIKAKVDCTTVQARLFFDHMDIIWKHFQNKGFYTIFAEDTPHQGLFRRFTRMGFRDDPVDFYYRPMSLFIRNWQLSSAERFCSFGQIEPLDMLHYVRDACIKLEAEHKPYFSFSFSNKMTHMKVANLGYMDIPIRDMLASLYAENAMNNTLIILFSDHGNRMDSFRNTLHGAFEERLPLLKMLFPKWFPKTHPNLWKTLTDNSNILTSHFDTHRTLLHLSGSRGPIIRVAKASMYGQSLFTPLNPRRTCTDAGIPIHHCACNVNKILSTKNLAVKSYARALTDHINTKIFKHHKLCEKWVYRKVLAAKMALATSPDTETGDEDNTIVNPSLATKENRYLISFSVNPRGALYEGSIIVANGTIKSIEDVTRTNEYGPNAWCMEDEEVKPYCFCKYTQ